MNGWRIHVFAAALTLILCGAGGNATARPAQAPMVAVTVVGYEATRKDVQRAGLLRRFIMHDVTAVGFDAVPGRLLCDDADDGAQSIGAQYYIVVTPAKRWQHATLALYRVGNRIALRKELVALDSASARLAAVRTLMHRQGWSVAYAPHEGC